MEWVSVKDVLPVDHEHVLVFDKREGICRAYIYLNSWSHYPIGSYATDGCLFDVSHWTPLPEPPK